MSKLEWWWYVHTNWSIQVKRYFDDRDLQDARESPFVQRLFMPFEANSRDDAEKYILDLMNEVWEEK